MTDDEKAILFVKDMLSYSKDALTFAIGIDKSDFLENKEKQYAIVRALEVVGEAAKSIPHTIRDRQPDIPWRQISGMRDKLIHHYFGVRLDEVWSVVERDLPDLIQKLEPLLTDLERRR